MRLRFTPLLLALASCKPEPAVLVAAVERSDAPAVEKLLAKGADPEATGGNYNQRVLSIAAVKGDVATVKSLLAHHADPNRADPPLMGSAGQTALQQAASAGQAEVVRVLLANGAHVEGGAEPSEETALAHAAERGRLDVIDVLLQAGAKVDGIAEDGVGYPPLVVAAEEKQAAAVRKLLAAHAKVDRRDVLGITALNAATAKEDLEMTRTLLAAGADPLAANRAGWTPAFTAQYHDVPALIALYKDAGVTDFKMHAPPPLPPSGFGTITVPVISATAQ